MCSSVFLPNPILSSYYLWLNNAVGFPGTAILVPGGAFATASADWCSIVTLVRFNPRVIKSICWVNTSRSSNGILVSNASRPRSNKSSYNTHQHEIDRYMLARYTTCACHVISSPLIHHISNTLFPQSRVKLSSYAWHLPKQKGNIRRYWRKWLINGKQ